MFRRTLPLCAAALLLGGLLPAPTALHGQGKDKDDKKDKDEIRLRQEVKRLHEEIQERNQALKIKDKQLDAAVDRLRDIEKENKKFRTVLDDMRDDIMKLQKVVADKNKMIRDLMVEMERLEVLLTEREIQNPPVGKVAGTVKKVDKGAYTLSVGSDAGLKKGHTLEVYRTKPQLTPLGVLLITDVQAGQATARLRYRPKGAPAIEAGDQVADEVRVEK